MQVYIIRQSKTSLLFIKQLLNNLSLLIKNSLDSTDPFHVTEDTYKIRVLYLRRQIPLHPSKFL